MADARANHDPRAAAGLCIRGVRFRYPGRRKQPGHDALRGIDLEVPAGETVAMLGPNGSGKSTLIKIICGMLPPDAGTVELFAATRPADIRLALSVVFHSNGLDPHLTVYENLRDQAALYGITGREAKATISRELQRAGLTDRRDSRVRTLSKGLARRVDLARAMLHRPRLLMLDEPTTGLDPVAREAFLKQLQERRDGRPLTVLLSTHLVDEAERCDRVVLLHRGRIIADDTPAVLRKQAGARRVTVLHSAGREPPPIGEQRWQRSAGGWSMPLADDIELVKKVAAQLAAARLAFSLAPPTLADVFEQLAGASLDGADHRAQPTPTESAEP